MTISTTARSTLKSTTHLAGAALALFLCLALFGATASAKGTGPGTKAVRSANDTISALLKKKVAAGSAEEKALSAQVTDSVRGFLDVDALGMASIAKHAETVSKEQKQEFLGLLRKLIEARYVEGLRANLEYDVAYVGETEKNATERIVKTEITAMRRGRPFKISIDYKLVRNGKMWQAVDVVTDGIGLVENYRSQFNSIIKKKGFDGLLELMRKREAKSK